MSNVFKRPMFRRGGGVNMNGIMSGIRDEYEDGGPTARERYEQIIKNYENPQAVTKEDFDKDLNHFKYIKRLLKRYKNTGVLKTHLLLIHFIVVYNIFGEAATPMLFFKIEKELWATMKSFIMFLGKFPEYPKTYIHDIQVDLYCLHQLYTIYKDDKKNSK